MNDTCTQDVNTPASATAKTVSVAPQRLVSLDTYRGFVMLLMVAEVLHLGHVAHANPDSGFWAFLAHHQSHVSWIGCSLHDLIQPSFSFMVGVALPFSLASRLSKGHSFNWMAVHAFWRAFILIFLGVFLRSMGHSMTHFTFEDTLSQIGLGYGFLFLLGTRTMKTLWIAIALILGGYWLAFALYPLPPQGFDYTTVGVANDWPFLMDGFEAHWNKNTNFAHAFGVWFLNLWPRESEFLYNGGGYLTLSFIPTLATMILGLIAGRIVRKDLSHAKRVQQLGLVGLSCIAVGLAVHHLGLCPSVKRIWTPSWTLFSGGWCFLILAGLYAIIDMWQIKRWAFPLVVLGMNSIAIYCMSWMLPDFIRETVLIHLGPDFFNIFGEGYSTLVSGSIVTLFLWWVLYWMYKRKLFLKI